MVKWLARIALLAVGLPLVLLGVLLLLSVTGTEAVVAAKGVVVPSDLDPLVPGTTGLRVIAGISVMDIDAVVTGPDHTIVRVGTAKGRASFVALLYSIEDKVALSSGVPGSDATWPPFVYLAKVVVATDTSALPGQTPLPMAGTLVDVEFHLGFRSFLERLVARPPQRENGSRLTVSSGF